MQRRPVIIVVHELAYGGATNAVVEQARMFLAAGHPTTIATLSSERRAAVREQQLRETGQLPAEIATLNVVEDSALRQERPITARGRWAATLRRSRARARDAVRERSLIVEEGEEADGGRYRRLFDSTGAVVRSTTFDAEGRIASDERSRADVVVRRELFRSGSLAERVLFDPATGNKTQERFYTRDGFCYLVRSVSATTGKGTGVVALDRDTRRATRYPGLPDWGAAWLEQVAREQPDRPIVLAESPSAIPKIARIPVEVASRVGMLHNNQFASPFSVGSPLRGDHEPILDAVGTLDALVVLTPQQRGDIVDLVGQPERIRVVPNSVVVPDVDVVRDPRLVSIVSRLSTQKAMHEAIAAMSTVLEQVPEARLEIYGRGPDKARLEKVIAASGHADRITLEGRTQQPAEAMARSLCTLSTSEWEAMPLSILESMAAGTPVVAYDCLYGPAALIADGETGRLVPQGDRRALADAVIAMLRDPAAAERMGAAAREHVAAHHSPAAVSAIWEQLFSELS